MHEKFDQFRKQLEVEFFSSHRRGTDSVCVAGGGGGGEQIGFHCH